MFFEGLILNGMHGLILALTPTERWQAARTPPQGLMTNRWFILICIVALVVLTAMLFWVSLQRIRQENRKSDRVLIDLAEKKALTVRECQILQMIAKRSGTRRPESVFSNRAAFERGAVQAIEKTLAGRGSQEKQRLITEVSLLRGKIGFGKEFSALGATQSKSLSSRQIPERKRVTLIPTGNGEAKAVEAIVHRNRNHELCLQVDDTIKVTFGTLWSVRYFLGASVWEFDTSVLSYDGVVLVLTHSDHVRFVNRRRFLRVPVIRRALIASFPFKQRVECSDADSMAKKHSSKSMPLHPIDAYGSPEFTAATVTELGGPGLRIETTLDVKTGDRVLVVFDLEVEPLVSEDIPHPERRSRLIEDIGEVRHVKGMDGCVSIAVELSGLKDTDVNELIRATNAALIDINEKKKVKSSGKARAGMQEVSV